MPDSDIITRCPQCNTAFRVTTNQLAVAEGVVRCGSCLSVFKAIDHQSTDVETENTPSTQASKVTTSAPREEKNLIDDNTLINDEEEQGLNLDDDIYDLDTNNKSKKTSLFDRKLQPISQHSKESADESWALDILADLEEDEIEPIIVKRNKEPEQVIEPAKPTEPPIENKPTKTPRPEIEPSIPAEDSPLDLEEYSPPPEKPKKKKRFSLFKSKPIQSEVADEPLDFDETFEADESQNNYPEENEALHAPVEHSSEAQNDLEALYFDEEEYATPAEPDIDPEPYITDEPETDETNEYTQISDDEIEDAMNSRTSYASERSDYLSSIQPEPVEMEWYESERTQRWLWIIGATALGLTLVVQVATFQFDTLSKRPSYRPYYETACKLVGCQLPNLVNTKKIRATNLVVRSLPGKENALIIDAILINNAGFAQPYPALRLEFSDLNSQLIASRDLQPSEYLRGELAGARQMPNNQPIQLSLPIIDPGETAVNYQLNVIRAKP